jgi:hypothetical protein
MTFVSRLSFLSCLAILACSPRTALAQSSERFQVGGELVIANSEQLDSTDVGIAGRASWHPWPLLGVEGELGFYPSDLPDETAISANRLEGLFGVTVGPRWQRVRPFARVRPGFLRVAEAPGPIACILIFPPPLSCTLAAGQTVPAIDVGGGVEVPASGRAFLRVDVGARLLRYPGPAIDRDREAHADDFWGRDFRLGIGAGWRF